jgi:hypothetical protein
MATSKRVSAETDKKHKREINILKKKEHWMKWAIWAAAILILLLLLLLGFATDWTRGLFKDNELMAPGTSQESLTAQDGTSAQPLGTNGGGGGSSQTSNGTNGTSGTSGSSTTTEKTNTSTTTNNGSTPSTNRLLEFYQGSGLGDNIDDLIQQAQAQGIAVECHNDVLIQTCTFSDNGHTVTTKNIAGIDGITSITNDL